MIKTGDEIEKIREAGKILAKTLAALTQAAEEGITLKDLDDLARGLIRKAGAEPAFLGYKPGGATKGFPAAICASLNDVVVHGVPTVKRRLKNGDLLKLDLGVRFHGYCADSAVTLGIGEISEIGKKLLEATKEALTAAIAAARTGNTLGDIGFIIKKTAQAHNFKVVKGLTGHGIGKNVHEDPSVFNDGEPSKGLKLKKGIVLAIEPMFSAGSDKVKQLADESYATVDGSLSAHFEHTVVITDGKAEVVTQI